MTSTLDLFDASGVCAASGFHAHYPDAPGHQGGDTSHAAAKAIAGDVPAMQKRVLAALRKMPMTSFELAAETGLDYGTVQPRTSELKVATKKRPALICDSGLRRTNPKTKRSAIVWRLVCDT